MITRRSNKMFPLRARYLSIGVQLNEYPRPTTGDVKYTKMVNTYLY